MKPSRAIRAITSLSLGVLAIAAISWLGLGQISGQISRIDVFKGLSDRPEKTSAALNYLIVGSDSREGLSREQIKALRVGSTAVAAGGRSDTMLLVHISKSRDSAYIVSLPRDTLTTIPAHKSTNGVSDIPDRPGKLNSAYAFGGAPLLIQTIEAQTNLKIDHYVEISFAGFAGLVDAIGGIELCTKVAIDDSKSHLVLDAGVHTLNGIDALKYVRTRDFDGRGDIGRMERQQQFVSAVLRKATSGGVLLNPIKLTNFYNAAIDSVKMDSAMDKNDLLTLARQLQNLSFGNVRTLTVPIANPNGRFPGVGSVVIWDEELAANLWDKIRGDEALLDIVELKPLSSSKPVLVDKFKSKTAADNPCALEK